MDNLCCNLFQEQGTSEVLQDENVVDLREDDVQLSVECTDDAVDRQVTRRGDHDDENTVDFVDLELPIQCTELP